MLLEKPGKLAQPLVAEHVGFTCPDLFVVGYGMDVAHAFRELPYVGVVEDEPAAPKRRRPAHGEVRRTGRTEAEAPRRLSL